MQSEKLFLKNLLDELDSFSKGEENIGKKKEVSTELNDLKQQCKKQRVLNKKLKEENQRMENRCKRYESLIAQKDKKCSKLESYIKRISKFMISKYDNEKEMNKEWKEFEFFNGLVSSND